MLTFAFVLMSMLQFNRDEPARVCFYEHSNYQGWEQCYALGDEIADLRSRKNRISSIRISGRARVIVYEGSAFEGTSAEFTADVPDLALRNLSGIRSWNDRIESVRIGNDFPGRGLAGRVPQQQERDGICVYEHAGYKGRSECWRVGDEERDLARVNRWNDKISSVRIFGRAVAVFHRDAGFRGEELTVDRDIPDLAQVGMNDLATWNDEASSVSIELPRGGGRFGRFRGGR
jgi:hypothetical protein